MAGDQRRSIVSPSLFSSLRNRLSIFHATELFSLCFEFCPKTRQIIAVVLGCFAVLWPKIFYPMLVGSGAGSNAGRQGEILVF